MEQSSAKSGKAETSTEKKYKDFVVRLEIKMLPAGNNGLAIRYPVMVTLLIRV